MKEYIIYSRKGVTSPDFHLKDLPGSGGRMDLLARSIISALWLSHDMRRDTKIIISLNGAPDPPISISFNGKELRKVSPNERNIAIWIKKALKSKDTLEDKEWKETHSGIMISKKSFKNLMEQREDRNNYILHGEGRDIEKINIKEDPVFILGDNKGIPKEVLSLLENYSPERISIGPKKYFTSQSITLMNNKIDRRNK